MQILQCDSSAVGCCQCLQTLHYILQTGLFHQFPLPLAHAPHTQRACAPGQDSGHRAQLSFRVASESAGCDLHLARVIIRLSYMGIIRLVVINSQFPQYFQKQLVAILWPL